MNDKIEHFGDTFHSGKKLFWTSNNFLQESLFYVKRMKKGEVAIGAGYGSASIPLNES